MSREFLYGILFLLAAISIKALSRENHRITRNGLISSGTRWKKFYMFLDPEYDDKERALIKKAASELQIILPCVQFRFWPKGKAPSNYMEPYIHVTKSGDGCSSHVGKISNGTQKMSLKPNCMYLGTIIHEMVHALGFHHEQSRPDRDDYVKVNFKNIEEGKKHNFKKYNYNEVNTFGVPYNPNSIMQYSSQAFSANGKPTIVSQNGTIIPRHTKLQKSDILKLKRMYNC